MKIEIETEKRREKKTPHIIYDDGEDSYKTFYYLRWIFFSTSFRRVFKIFERRIAN